MVATARKRHAAAFAAAAIVAVMTGAPAVAQSGDAESWQRVAGLSNTVAKVHAGPSCARWSYAIRYSASRIYRGKGPFGVWRAFGPKLPEYASDIFPAGGAVVVGTSSSQVYRFTSSGRTTASIRDGALTFAQGHDPRGPIYAGGAQFGTVWVSNDLGRHWRRLTALSREIAAGVTGLVVGPRGRVVASVMNPELGNHPSGFDDGVYESLDAGKTWHRAADGLTSSRAEDVWGRLPGPLLAQTQSSPALHWWDDATHSWIPSSGLGGASSVTAARGRSRVYAGAVGGGGAFVSTDGGRSFEPFGLDGLNVLSVSTNPRGDLVYAVRARPFKHRTNKLFFRFTSKAAEQACRQGR